MGDPEEPLPGDDGEGEGTGETGTGPAGDAVEELEDRDEAARAYLASMGLPSGAGGDFTGAIASAVNHATNTAPAAAAPGWTSIGPRNVGGAIRALIQDGNNPNVFYAGSASGGLWKSEDDGLSWRPAGRPDRVLPVGALALAPSDSRILIIGTGEPFGTTASVAALGGQGLFLSTDAGETWFQLAGPVAGGPGGNGAADHYTAIAVDPVATEPAGVGRILTIGTAVTGVEGTTFQAFFAPGDILSVGGNLRVVTVVTSNARLTIDRPLPADLGTPTDYRRATKRFWATAETGLWRFEPGRGFVAEGPIVGVAVGSTASDVVLAQDPGNAGRVVLYVGLGFQGLFRGVFTRATGATVWTQCVLPQAVPGNPNIAPGQIGQVRVAMSRTNPIQVYAVMENRGAIAGAGNRNHPTHAYHSNNFGTNFTRRIRPYNPAAAGLSAMADYALVIAVHPTTPATVILGSQHLHLSTNSGQAWNQIMVGGQFEAGDRGQHSDQHAILFDVRNPNTVWVANDGGISRTERTTTVAPHAGWRKRSFGVNAAQFHSVRVHPTLPFLTGGGLRDLTTFLSYGGLTWYQVGFGDGGPTLFSADVRRFFPSHQVGVDQMRIGGAFQGGDYGTVIQTALPDVSPPAQMRIRGRPITGGIPANNSGPFVPVVEGHPTQANHMVVGRHRRAFRTTNAGVLNPAFAAIGPTLVAGEFVSAIAFIPGQPSNQFWMGTTLGQVFRVGAAVSPPWPGGATPPVHDLAIADAGGGNIRVAVCSAGAQGEVFVADVAGAGAVNWRRLTPGLPPGPFTSLAFDPTNINHLYVGTFAGVYGARDLPAFPMAAGAAVTWQTYNQGLPLAVVHDLALCPVTQTLRCATYGRGMYERSLAGTPANFQVQPVTLLIRNHLMDDGRAYAVANTLLSDPRRPAAPNPAIDDLHSFDIRVDAPRFRAVEQLFRFGEALDGAEFDESLVHDPPILGDTNIVYVQVQNRGTTAAHNVDVHLYFASAANAANPPDLQAGFRAAFPGDPPAGAWLRAAPKQTVGEIGAGQPAVVRFEWVPPFDLGPFACLLALCTTADAVDQLNLGAMTAANDVILNLVRNERRAAVRVTTVVNDPVYIRDGVDDDGTEGSVAWGGRSPDIVVLPAAPPANVNTNPDFTDLDDRRLGDRVRAGVNHIIVRVHNRSGTPVAADVDVYRVQLADLDHPANWVRLNGANAMRTPQIPPRSWRFTAATQLNVVDAATTFILVALVSPVGSPVPKPDHTVDVTSLDALWRFLKTGSLAESAAMRALRRTP